MKLKKTLTAGVIAFSIMATQTGCLIGLVAWPLWIVGSVVGVTGAGLTIGGAVVSDPALLGTGVGLMVLGGILDTENPGHVDAVNPLPHEAKIADMVGVTVDDIENYNDNLNQI